MAGALYKRRERSLDRLERSPSFRGMMMNPKMPFVVLRVFVVSLSNNNNAKKKSSPTRSRPNHHHRFLSLFFKQPMSSQSASSSSSSSSSSDANVVTDFEHSTGLYRAELEGLAQGKDIFDHYDFTRAPKGTKESPCVVTSEMDYRVVGVTDPDDDSIVIWGRLEEGKGPMLIGDEWFVHKRVGGGGH